MVLHPPEMLPASQNTSLKSLERFAASITERMEPDFDGHQGSDDTPPAVAGKAWSSLDYSENKGDKK